MEKGLCAALGDYDGVHSGHIAVITAAVQASDNLVPTVYTFRHNCKNARLITDRKAKARIFESLGIKKVIYDDFDKIKEYTPLRFVKEILVGKHNIKTVVCGVDFRFGKNAAGDTKVLKELCEHFGIKLITVGTLDIDGKKVSSTDIRKYIENGQMQEAKKLLGRRFCVTGTVIPGKQLGQTQKTPTVNIGLCDGCVVPKYGVYITNTVIDGKKFNSISNVGIRPSVESTDKPNIETNIFDFNRDIYGKEITVEFIKMIRPEIKFGSCESLFEQIGKDISQAKSYFIGECNE